MLPIQLWAQDEEVGKIELIQDSRLDRIINHHVITNEEKGTTKGFRIQLVSAANRQDALKIKSECRQRFPKINTHLIYQQPYFKFRVGDYLTKLEAYKQLQDLKIFFDDAFIVRDEIDYQAL